MAVTLTEEPYERRRMMGILTVSILYSHLSCPLGAGRMTNTVQSAVSEYS